MINSTRKWWGVAALALLCFAPCALASSSLTMTGAGNIVSQSSTVPARSCEGPVFANFSVTVAGNNLTVTLLNAQGATPSAAAPVLICSPLAGGGTWVAITAATTQYYQTSSGIFQRDA